MLKSTHFPPYDPWLSGAYINYYYFGYVVIGNPIKLLGIVPNVAYNLALPMLFSLTGLGAFSVAFDLVAAYHLVWYAGLVVLVFTTISVVIPSTPGYVGTFHYLCQIALVMFGVSSSEALSFAVITHIVGVLPVAVAGLPAERRGPIGA